MVNTISEEEYICNDDNYNNSNLMYDNLQQLNNPNTCSINTNRGFHLVNGVTLDEVEEPLEKYFITGPISDDVDLDTALRVGQSRKASIVIYNESKKTGYTKSLKPDWISADICDLIDKIDINIPSIKTISSKKIKQSQGNNSNDFKIYINCEIYQQFIHEKLNECQNKIKEQQKSYQKRYDMVNYVRNGNSISTFNDFKSKQLQEAAKQEAEQRAHQSSEQISAYNTALNNNYNSLNVLKQMNENKDQLINKNSYSINDIDETILTTSEKINNIKDKYEFNNRIIKLLRKITLCIFIIAMFVLCYFGVRDKYNDNLKSSGTKNVSK